MVANTWQGEFPWENLLQDGYAGTSPVKSFPAEGWISGFGPLSFCVDRRAKGPAW